MEVFVTDTNDYDLVNESAKLIKGESDIVFAFENSKDDTMSEEALCVIADICYKSYDNLIRVLNSKKD